jgi:hypothetical protein
MATEEKQFTGWISVEGGLVNLAHVHRITLQGVDGLFLLVASLADGEQVTLAASEAQDTADKALRYLAANVRAIYPVRG